VAGESLELVGDKRGLDTLIAKAQAIATGRISRALMPRIAGGEVRRMANNAKSSQTSPNGKTWPKTKSGEALKWPSQAKIVVALVNGKVTLKVTGPQYLAPQHSGWRRVRAARPAEMAKDAKRIARTGKGKVALLKRYGGKPRRIVPKGAVPKPWAKVITEALNAGWRSFMVSTSVGKAKR
jgi:hypothetical protein